MFKKSMVSGLLFLILIFPLSAWAAFSNLVSFGDSLSDNGISRYPVYDMEGFTRSSNGWVWVDYLAQNLGLSHDGRAYGGALTGLGNVASETPTQFGLLWQISNYSPAGNISNTLFTVWAGGNDLRKITDPSTASAVIGNALNNIGVAVSSLYAMGARYIMIPNLPDLGITPEVNWNAQLSGGATMASVGFNAGLDSLISTLDSNLPGLTLYEPDMFSFLNNYIIPGGFFANTKDPWLTSGNADAGTYLFFDKIHPTTRAHQMIAQYAAETLTPVPVPAAGWLLGSGLILIMGIRRRS